MALFSRNLLPASFRGVPFAVVATDEQFGRRIAMHVFPGRDEPWAEDMGRAPRAFRLRGFIVADDAVYAGGPIALQRALLVAAAEKSGAGILTHPTLGILNVSCRGLALGEDLAAGTASEVSFEFIESGARSFPSLLTSSSGLLSAANLCKVALAADFARALALVVSSSSPPVSAPEQQEAIALRASAWGVRVVQLGADATALNRLVARLPGNNGRYAAGANAGFSGQNRTLYANDTTIADLAAAASTQRVAIVAAAIALQLAAAELGATASAGDLAAAAAALVDALVAACADPADQIRLLTGLVSFATDAGGAVGGAMTLAFRRAVVAALATASADYQPASYDDAFALLASLAELFDTVALEAADAGDDESFAAIRGLKAKLVTDLRARGASLAQVQTFAVNRSLPAVVLAQRLYRDLARSDELVRQANPAHPLFMPTTFQALAA